VRRLIHLADSAAFAHARRLYAISPVVADRLRRFNGLEAEVLLTPPHADHPYRCEPAEPYIVALGRISDGKRQALAVEAMAHAGPDARLIIAGPPDTTAVLEALEQTIDEAGARGRIEVIPRFITDEEKLGLMARCTASIYLPIDEDSYGYVCYEAAMSSKPTITGTDAGGALTLVAHGVSGLVVEPRPAELGKAIDRMLAEPERAAELGRTARSMAQELDLSWERVVEELTR
jgi:glycosyltransferase involved in cell wall biosynthesis